MISLSAVQLATKRARWKAVCRIIDEAWSFSGLVHLCPAEWHGQEFCRLTEQGDSSPSLGVSAWLNLNSCMWRINGYMKQYFLSYYSPSNYLLSKFKTGRNIPLPLLSRGFVFARENRIWHFTNVTERKMAKLKQSQGHSEATLILEGKERSYSIGTWST